MTLAVAGKAGAAEGHWAFQPVKRPAVPVIDSAWPSSDIDRFVLAKLRENKMQPAKRADRRTLIRRLSFDLAGLPPSPGEVEAFVNSTWPDAYRELVDRLLASPRFGERWARHWLDVARYADTKGYLAGNQARLFTHSYTYRDYVIDAFNNDLPFDRFLIEQLAADRLELGEDKRPLAAMGFLTLGRRFLNNPHDIIDDRIDVVTRGMMGLTVSCARCHDHKYDPVPTADYYSLYGVFASSHEPKDKPFISDSIDPVQRASFEKERKRREDSLKNYEKEQYARIRKQVKQQTGDYIWAAHRAAGVEAGKIDELARKSKLDPDVTRRWMSHLAKRRESADPVFAVWFALAKLDEKSFATEAKRVLAEERLAKASEAVRQTLDQAETLEAAAKALGKLCFEADEKQPMLREVVYSDASPAKLSDGDVWRIMEVAGKEGIRSRRRRFDEVEGEHPGAPNRAMVLLDKSSPGDAHVFLRGNPGSRGANGSASFFTGALPWRTQAVCRWQRTVGDGTGHRFAGQSADRTSHGQPDLAAVVRTGVGKNTERLRRPCRTAVTPETTRSLGCGICREWLVYEAAHPLYCAVDHLPTGRDRSRGVRRARSVEPVAVADEPSPTRP